MPAGCPGSSRYLRRSCSDLWRCRPRRPLRPRSFWRSTTARRHGRVLLRPSPRAAPGPGVCATAGAAQPTMGGERRPRAALPDDSRARQPAPGRAGAADRSPAAQRLTHDRAQYCVRDDPPDLWHAAVRRRGSAVLSPTHSGENFNGIHHLGGGEGREASLQPGRARGRRALSLRRARQLSRHARARARRHGGAGAADDGQYRSRCSSRTASPSPTSSSAR